MKIGILQTGHVPPNLVAKHGDYDKMFQNLLSSNNFSFNTYLIVDGEYPSDVNDANGWIITGSKYGVYENLPWIAPLENFVRAAYRRSVRTVGVCFGHQLIASTLGGKVVKKGWIIGPRAYQLETSTKSTQLIAFHQDQVVNPPAAAATTGSSAGCPHAELSYGKRAYSLQPHPEFDSDFTTDLLTERKNDLPTGLYKATISTLNKSQPLQTTSIAQKITNFFSA